MHSPLTIPLRVIGKYDTVTFLDPLNSDYTLLGHKYSHCTRSTFHAVMATEPFY